MDHTGSQVAPQLYVISDLHMCDGSAIEDFYPEDDAALAEFIDDIALAPGARLIINGDFIDFVQIQPEGRAHWLNEVLDASEDESLAKLECAIAAHGPVFDALGRFVAAGHELHFHYGNHDIDLIWPRVQERIRARLGHPGGAAITFGEAHSIGGVVIEHGHQADKHVNGFPTQPDVIRIGPDGVPRLERCWGTRFVEEFYNKVESLEGCDVLDNARPRMKAAVIIIKHALFNSAMYPMLSSGVRVIMDALALLKTEQDFRNAAGELGVPGDVIRWIVKVAGWLGLQSSDAPVAKSSPGAEPAPVVSGLDVASLKESYAEGAKIATPEELVAQAPAAPEAKGMFSDFFRREDGAPAAPVLEAEVRKSLDYVATELVGRYPEARAFCLGHTHLVTEAGLPIPNSTARYFNSGSWTMTLNLSDLEDPTFAILQDRANYRRGRDYVRITWPEGPEAPQIENFQW